MNSIKRYENCKVYGVYKRLLGHGIESNELLVEVEVPKENGLFDTHIIKIQKNIDTFIQEVSHLLEGKSKRVYAAYGMENIDIYLNIDKVYIECSPFDGCYETFEFTVEEMEKILGALL